MPESLSWWVGVNRLELSREIAERYAVNRSDKPGPGRGAFTVTPAQRAKAIERRMVRQGARRKVADA